MDMQGVTVTDEQLDAAYSAVHNQVCFYESMGTLRDALAVYKQARQEYSLLLAEHAMVAQLLEEKRERLVAIDDELTKMDAKRVAVQDQLDALTRSRDAVLSSMASLRERLVEGDHGE